MCQSCEALTINGVYCHETGCPEAWRNKIRECAECGQSFKPEHKHQKICAECSYELEDCL